MNKRELSDYIRNPSGSILNHGDSTGIRGSIPYISDSRLVIAALTAAMFHQLPHRNSQIDLSYQVMSAW